MLWFVYETEYPDEGTEVVEAEDASTACLAVDGDTADYSARPVTVADVEWLREEVETLWSTAYKAEAFTRIANLVVPEGKAYTVGRVVDEVTARLARPLAGEAEAERLREEVASLTLERDAALQRETDLRADHEALVKAVDALALDASRRSEKLHRASVEAGRLSRALESAAHPTRIPF